MDKEKLDATFMSFMESVGQLCTENMRLREALSFYADNKSWEWGEAERRPPTEPGYDYNIHVPKPTAYQDAGAKAREALKEIE